MVTVCNLTSGPVHIQDDKVTCDGHDATPSHQVTIVGWGDTEISINGSTVAVELQEVKSSSQLTATGSTVMVLVSAASEFRSIRCRGQSNLTFAGLPGGSLEVWNGINAEGNCEAIVFVNGTYAVTLDDQSELSAIGSNSGTTGPSNLGTLTIVGGTVHAIAQSSLGAAIGSGLGALSVSNVDNLSILGGNVVAIGPTFAPGIGSGLSTGTGIASVGDINVNGGNVTATSQGWSAGLGSGHGGHDGISTVHGLNIHGGNVSATTIGDAASIGAGGQSIGSSRVDRLGIFGGFIIVTGSASGIGAGDSGSVGPVTIGGGLIDCSAVALSSCFNAGSITTIGNGSVTVFTHGKIGSSSNWTTSGAPELYFEYVSTSLKEDFGGLSLVHLGNISLPSAALYLLRIWRVGGEFERTLLFNKARSTGCAFSVSAPGDYTISFEKKKVFFESSTPGAAGFLHHNGRFQFTANEIGVSFFAHVDFIPSSTASAVFRQSSPPSSSKALFPTQRLLGYSAFVPQTQRLAGSSRFRDSAFLRESQSLVPSVTPRDNANFIQERRSAKGIVPLSIAMAVALVVLAVGMLLRHRCLGSKPANENTGVVDGLMSGSMRETPINGKSGTGVEPILEGSSDDCMEAYSTTKSSSQH